MDYKSVHKHLIILLLSKKFKNNTFIIIFDYITFQNIRLTKCKTIYSILIIFYLDEINSFRTDATIIHPEILKYVINMYNIFLFSLFQNIIRILLIVVMHVLQNHILYKSGKH